MTTSAHNTEAARFAGKYNPVARNKAFDADTSYRHAQGTHSGFKLKEIPVADRGKLDRSPLRQRTTGATMLFRRTDADRQVCRPVRMPGDPDAAHELRLREYAERRQQQGDQHGLSR